VIHVSGSALCEYGVLKWMALYKYSSFPFPFLSAVCLNIPLGYCGGRPAGRIRTFIDSQVGGGHVADTRVVQRLVGMKVDRFALDRLVLLVECFEDEDDRDQHREALLRESSDVADESAQVERDHDEQEQRQPHPDPEAQLQIIKLLASAHETDISATL